ncbi:MAG: hypothetical protein LUE13_06815 [Akkermansiaceae bacterium]|nr:hypothetical protein [Akkermansiaceae bacterium]
MPDGKDGEEKQRGKADSRPARSKSRRSLPLSVISMWHEIPGEGSDEKSQHEKIFSIFLLTPLFIKEKNDC